MFASLTRGYEPQSAFDPKTTIIYVIIGVELLAAVVAYSALGLSFSSVALVLPSASMLITLLAAWAARRAHLNSIATWLEATALTYLQGLIGWSLFFPGTVISLPYADWWLSGADRAIGFDFPSLFAAVHLWPWALIYHSFNWQAAVIILALVVAKRDVWPMILALSIALILTVLIYPFAPAIGPIGYYRIGPPGAWTSMIEALRDHGVRHIGPEMLVGMVSLPSFHAAAGAIFVWITWPVRSIRWPFLILNAAMIFSTIPYGQHYLVDVIAGLATAVVGIIVAVRFYARREFMRSKA